MSLTQTYYIASTARTKLGREASRSDHDLRLLVGHANLLDVLMVELQDAEKEQEAWFNDSIRKNNKSDQSRHVQWIDSIAEEYEDDSDSDSDSDIYEEDEPEFTMSLQQSEYTVTSREIEEDEEDELDFELQDMEYDDEHALTRVDSHPPELVHEDSSDSEDESMPTSPNESELDFSQYQPTQPIKTTPYSHKIDEREHFRLANSIQQGPMISAY
ncbi:hypothetical protein AAFC00_005981 [Neodothiora populina]